MQAYLLFAPVKETHAYIFLYPSPCSQLVDLDAKGLEETVCFLFFYCECMRVFLCMERTYVCPRGGACRVGLNKRAFGPIVQQQGCPRTAVGV